MRSSLKQDMKFKDRLTLMKRDIKTVPDKFNKQSLFDRSKGFSKVEIQEDEDDMNIYLSLRRAKSAHVTKVLENAYNFVLTDDEVYVHYPIPSPDGLSRSRTIVTVSEVKDYKQHRELTKHLQTKAPKTRPKTCFPTVTSSSNNKPKYVKKLESLSCQDFDQFTDGTMHLEERRFQQRQRESMLPQVGHLPVRRRYFTDSPQVLATQVQMNSCVINNVTALPSKNIRIYLPKSARMNKEAQDNMEQKRFLKLKQEHQAQEYAKVMATTAKFLGKKPEFIHLIQRPHLDREEYIMLEHMRRKVPSFKTAATLIKWMANSKTAVTSEGQDVSTREQSHDV